MSHRTMKMSPLADTTDVKFIPTVISRQPCGTHQVPVGTPCYHITGDEIGGYFAGVCNKRARKAGFNAKINPKSLDRNMSRG